MAASAPVSLTGRHHLSFELNAIATALTPTKRYFFNNEGKKIVKLKISALFILTSIVGTSAANA
ncbi:hypothetical protein SAMN06265784_11958 [Paraburkholderia susongensis]|uniref:Uncharacterized protein n=1 Tax=Paraburkholderia susongensis TaxID=1515439 RepID=A0A1X7M4H2_9BURK|nr:hypothetical protein SAMN06265784_11958 [Paraburkholderia susongensis]